MPEYVSKPQRVEAIQWTGNNQQEVHDFLHGHAIFTGDSRYGWDLKIEAGKDGAQEWVPVPVGHWVVRASGNLTDHWPVDDSYFQRKYERVDAQDVLSRLSGDD